MENQLMQCIDIINESVDDAEMDTIVSLSDTYMKAYHILESVDETTDISAFTVFQEGVIDDIDAPLKGWHGESTIKKILLFIPRLLYKILKIAMIIVICVIGILIAPATIIASKVRDKKYAGHPGEIYEVNYNIDFIYDFMYYMEQLSMLICEGIIMAPKDVNPIAYVIDKNYSTISEGLSKIKKYISEFDEKAYEPTQSLGNKGVDRINEFKQLQNKINLNIQLIEKYNRNSSTEGLSDESKKHLAEFTEVMTNWGKKSSELAAKLKEFEKAAKTAEPINQTGDAKNNV